MAKRYCGYIRSPCVITYSRYRFTPSRPGQPNQGSIKRGGGSIEHAAVAAVVGVGWRRRGWRNMTCHPTEGFGSKLAQYSAERAQYRLNKTYGCKRKQCKFPSISGSRRSPPPPRPPVPKQTPEFHIPGGGDEENILQIGGPNTAPQAGGGEEGGPSQSKVEEEEVGREISTMMMARTPCSMRKRRPQQ